MRSCSVKRTEEKTLSGTTWTDDVGVVWDGLQGCCEISAITSYRLGADARVMLRRGAEEIILISHLKLMSGHKLNVLRVLEDGDEVLIQYKAWTSVHFAISEFAEVSIKEVQQD